MVLSHILIFRRFLAFQHKIDLFRSLCYIWNQWLGYHYQRLIWKGSMPAMHSSSTATQFQVSHISQDLFLFLRSFLNKLTSLSCTSWEIIWWNTSYHHILLVTVAFTASLTIHAKLMCACACAHRFSSSSFHWYLCDSQESLPWILLW